MKLRNKISGEIVSLIKTLSDLNEEWEDYEEPKKHYEILTVGVVTECKNDKHDIIIYEKQRKIGNYFETEEEADKTLEKLKAFTRLKNNGFKFTEWGVGLDNELIIKAKYSRGQIYEDMNTCFGGE